MASTQRDFEGSRATALVYEPALWLGERLGMRKRRRELLAGAHGRVLEIGAGTGLNLALYTNAVDELVLTEPVAEMAARIRAKLDRGEGPARARIVAAPAEELPFADGEFDVVVSTLVLCTVGDPDAALAEVRRVLKPGGRLLFCEHVRSQGPRLARWQDRLERPWAAVGEGCHCNRDTLASIEAHFSLAGMRRERWRGVPPLVAPLIVGTAIAAGESR